MKTKLRRLIYKALLKKRNPLIQAEINFQYPTGWTFKRHMLSQIQTIADYYIAKSKGRYRWIYSDTEHMVLIKEIKENDEYQRHLPEHQRLVFKQISPAEIEVRQTCINGRDIRDYYILTGNAPRLRKSAYEIFFLGHFLDITFYEESLNLFCERSLNLICRYGGNSKEETCGNIRNILSSVKDSRYRITVRNTFCGLKALSAENCEELTATVRRWNRESRED